MDTNPRDNKIETITEPLDLPSQVEKLILDLKALNDEVYKNNFTSRQDFNKYSNFTTRLKVPHYEQLPSSCEVGELLEKGGALYICSAPNTYTLV